MHVRCSKLQQSLEQSESKLAQRDNVIRKLELCLESTTAGKAALQVASCNVQVAKLKQELELQVRINIVFPS